MRENEAEAEENHSKASSTDRLNIGFEKIIQCRLIIFGDLFGDVRIDGRWTLIEQ